MIGCQDSAHRRACGQQLQSVHQDSVMRQGGCGSHDDFDRVASLAPEWKNRFLKSGIAAARNI